MNGTSCDAAGSRGVRAYAWSYAVGRSVLCVGRVKGKTGSAQQHATKRSARVGVRKKEKKRKPE